MPRCHQLARIDRAFDTFVVRQGPSMAEQIGSFEAASYLAEIEALLDPAKLPKRVNLGTAVMPTRTSVAGGRAEVDMRVFET